jgi:hypothetical protein
VRQPWREGTPNFEVIREWNKSEVYTKAIAYFAERLGGGIQESAGRSSALSRGEEGPPCAHPRSCARREVSPRPAPPGPK